MREKRLIWRACSFPHRINREVSWQVKEVGDEITQHTSGWTAG